MKTFVQVTLLVAVLGAIGCKEEKKAEETDMTIPVKVVSSESLSQSQPVETSGLLTSESKANLSFKVGGIIREIRVEEGDRVSKGQLLATLNTTEITAQLGLAEENFVKAKRDAQRVQNLYQDSVSTKEQLENSLTALNIAGKQLEIMQFNLAQSRVVSPIDGVVIQKLFNAGEQIESGKPVVAITGTNSSDWVIQCGLTDKDWMRLKGGEKAEVTFDAFAQTFQGTVKSLSQGSDVASGLYQAEIRIDKRGMKLANGLFAKVTIYPKERTTMISVPVDALIEGENDSAFVFVADTKKAHKKAVKIAFLAGNKAFILSGVGVGEKVIREGSAYLTEGSDIKIIQ